MKTIAIIGAQLKQKEELFELLELFFPECQIFTIRNDIERDGEFHSSGSREKGPGE